MMPDTHSISINWELVREWLGAGSAAFLALKAAVRIGVWVQIIRGWWKATGRPFFEKHGLLRPPS